VDATELVESPGRLFFSFFGDEHEAQPSPFFSWMTSKHFFPINEEQTELELQSANKKHFALT